MVGDEEDHSIWRQSRRAWLTATTEVLFAHFPRENLDLDPLEPPWHLSGWKGQYESELRTVREGLRLLEALVEKIATTPLESQGQVR